MDRPFVFINVAITADGKIVQALAGNDLGYVNQLKENPQLR